MDIESRVYYLKPATLYRRTFYTRLHPLFTQQAACTPTRQAVCIKLHIRYHNFVLYSFYAKILSSP